ncbi:MAG: hypothetical protein D6701_07720 [Gemmatimonadetes bacterium]|nr:MAG: hypothetical protein D6701_07720 [Gemmatimonadota bacterium]
MWSALLLAAACAPVTAQEAPPADEVLVAGAVLAAPPADRAAAEVRAWNADGTLRVLRQGTNHLICLADRPGDDRFHVTCYHRALEPFMERGRELTRQGVSGMERQRTRWREAREGALPVPDHPVMLYNFTVSDGPFDPLHDDEGRAARLQALYMPYATPESTGLPARSEDGSPWLMWPGEPSAHVMIFLPPRGGG